MTYADTGCCVQQSRHVSGRYPSMELINMDGQWKIIAGCSMQSSEAESPAGAS